MTMTYLIASLNRDANGDCGKSQFFIDCHQKMDNNLRFADGSAVELEMQNMSMRAIVSAIPSCGFTRGERRNRYQMLKKVVTLPSDLQAVLRGLAREKRMEKAMDSELVMDEGSCSMDASADVGLDYGGEVENPENTEAVSAEEDNFLKAASPSVVRQCISEFIDATSNEAVRAHICMICAREMWAKEVERRAVDDIPNQHLLSPNEYHPGHKLTSGMLLERAVLDRERNRLYGDICHDCLRALNKKRTPALSLANGMWIGDVPSELSILTLPERVLVAKYFPAAYIVKLFPRQKGATHWSSSGLHSGVKGNVSTYKLNIEDIVDLVDPKIMPPPTKILASVIGVIIVGPRNMPERTMHGYFRVRRDCVREGLKWLSAHNPLYMGTEISEARLEELPMDGVPGQILQSARYSDDIEQLKRSTAGYVDDDAECVEDTAIRLDAAGMSKYICHKQMVC
jgi:hypothetical protein